MRVFLLPCLSNGDEPANSLIHSIVLNKISKDEKQEQKQNTFIGQIPNQRNIYVFSNSFHEAYALVVGVRPSVLSEDSGHSIKKTTKQGWPLLRIDRLVTCS